MALDLNKWPVKLCKSAMSCAQNFILWKDEEGPISLAEVIAYINLQNERETEPTRKRPKYEFFEDKQKTDRISIGLGFPPIAWWIHSLINRYEGMVYYIKYPRSLNEVFGHKYITLKKAEDRSFIIYNRYKIIGSGCRSTVYYGRFGTVPAAIKCLKSTHVDYWSERDLKIWQEMGSSQIVTLFGWSSWEKWDEKGMKYIVMELGKCDLKTWIVKSKGSEGTLSAKSKEIVKVFMSHAAKAVNWIHEKEFIHGNIKPENILIFEKPFGSEIAKLGDFSSSRKLIKGNCTKEDDVFALGFSFSHCLLMETQTVWENFYAADHLINWMVKEDAKDRPKISQVLRHPLFWDWEKCLRFLVDVAQSFNYKYDSNLLKTKEKIDNLYKQRTKNLNQDSSWKLRISPKVVTLLHQRKSNVGDKYYDGESVMMLVELIRDKCVHYQDLVQELMKDEFFGEQGFFSDEKYAKYFLTTFPGLVIFLFSVIGNENGDFLSVLCRRYFIEFEKVPLLPDNMMV
ncbi:unnamed protein product [Orchesella dallaii]|uniref:Protein kinase domain-containing protein n=1 Tax=Orchesella dallaii TaxID=48710 RepID=A0ABP1RMX1_9HEXA